MMAINDSQHFLMVVFLLISIILMVIHFVYIKIKVKITDAIKYFLNAHLMLIIWGAFLLLKYIKPEFISETGISYFMTMSITFVGYQILVFTYSYSFKKSISDKQSALFILIPFSCFLTYNIGVFIYEPRGYMLRIASATVLVCYLIIGLLYFAFYTIKTAGLNRTKQWTYLYTVIGFDIFAHIIYYMDASGISNIILIYLMPVYLVFLIGFTIKYRLYDKMPFVLEKIFHNANQGIIVINNYLNVIEFNKKFFTKYMNIDDIEVLEDFINQLKIISDNKLSVDNILYALKNVEKNHYSGDIKIKNSNMEFYLTYTVNSINDDYNQKVATMITFRDMTELTSLQNGIRDKNNQLISANNKLEEHMKNAQNLTAEKEREVLMAEINDTFGHSMTEILALLEVSVLLLEQEDNVEAIEKAIDDTKTRARLALAQMREAVSRYKKGVTTND